uniref:Ribosomal RNA small subunit methyltransferase NEP1 n=1 Tax=Aureoumbra lagunensis TaxID=44058 RepID=A0A7S3NDP7_9STRA|mmetsp:Transcript_6856/g.9594  ORF Transcript_6856/g.9594 Transcript_6856/m.9594 type:complete len:250 (+) Transcript_6856:16-765(+)
MSSSEIGGEPPAKRRKKSKKKKDDDAIIPDVVVQDSEENRKCIVILDEASLEIVKTRKGEFTLLNSDDHRTILSKHDRDPAECRPDIAHQELMAALDSPLNKAGLLKVYVRTKQNVLIDVHPMVRVPRTYKRFAGLMCQLLHKLKIRAADAPQTLFKVIKNPVERHLPPGTLLYGFSKNGTKYSPHHFAASLPDNKPIALVFGAMATGSISRDNHPSMLDMVCVSDYPLSGAVAMNRVLGAIEARWGIN